MRMFQYIMKDFADGIHYKWNTSQTKYVTNGIHYKRNTLQMEYKGIF